jgi:hypothetical protein
MTLDVFYNNSQMFGRLFVVSLFVISYSVGIWLLIAQSSMSQKQQDFETRLSELEKWQNGIDWESFINLTEKTTTTETSKTPPVSLTSSTTIAFSPTDTTSTTAPSPWTTAIEESTLKKETDDSAALDDSSSDKQQKYSSHVKRPKKRMFGMLTANGSSLSKHKSLTNLVDLKRMNKT